MSLPSLAPFFLPLSLSREQFSVVTADRRAQKIGPSASPRPGKKKRSRSLATDTAAQSPARKVPLLLSCTLTHRYHRARGSCTLVNNVALITTARCNTGGLLHTVRHPFHPSVERPAGSDYRFCTPRSLQPVPPLERRKREKESEVAATMRDHEVRGREGEPKESEAPSVRP